MNSERRLPVLDETLCTGCGDCVLVCPVECIETLGRMPYLSHPEDCISCGICAMVCPVDALIIGAESRDGSDCHSDRKGLQ